MSINRLYLLLVFTQRDGHAEKSAIASGSQLRAKASCQLLDEWPQLFLTA